MEQLAELLENHRLEVEALLEKVERHKVKAKKLRQSPEASNATLVKTLISQSSRISELEAKEAIKDDHINKLEEELNSMRKIKNLDKRIDDVFSSINLKEAFL